MDLTRHGPGLHVLLKPNRNVVDRREGDGVPVPNGRFSNVGGQPVAVDARFEPNGDCAAPIVDHGDSILRESLVHFPGTCTVLCRGYEAVGTDLYPLA